MPYRPDFVRERAHPSRLFFGASLPALAEMGRQKGYQLVGVTRAGVNAFFVRRELAAGLPDLGARVAYVLTRVRESRDETGRLSLAAGADRLRLIEELEVWDVAAGRRVRLKDLAIRYP